MDIRNKPPIKDTTILVRISTGDKQEIKEAAESIEKSSSEYILIAVAEKMENDKRDKLIKEMQDKAMEENKHVDEDVKKDSE